MILPQHFQQHILRCRIIIAGLFAAHKGNTGAVCSGYFGDFLTVRGNHHFIKQPGSNRRLNTVRDNGLSAKHPDIFFWNSL